MSLTCVSLGYWHAINNRLPLKFQETKKKKHLLPLLEDVWIVFFVVSFGVFVGFLCVCFLFGVLLVVLVGWL